MHATWIPNALLAGWSLPAEAAIALVGSGAVALVLVAAGQADWLLAVLALPAGQADDLALLRAGEVPVDIVARPAQNVALLAVVVGLTCDAIGIDQSGPIRLVHAARPFILDREPAVHRVLDDQLFLVEVVCCGGRSVGAGALVLLMACCNHWQVSREGWNLL